MHPVQPCGGFQTIFFLLSVSAPLKERKRNLQLAIFQTSDTDMYNCFDVIILVLLDSEGSDFNN